MKKIILVLACLIAAVNLVGCDKPGAPREEKVLNLYIWSEYLPQSVLDKFTQRTGIKVNVDNYDSNETLLAKLRSGVAEYDLCVPSDYMVRVLIAEKLILPIDHAKVPNLGNIDARFLSRGFDPGNRYSVPYLWGTTGLGYNKQQVTEPVESWKIVFDKKYAGKVLLLDDMRECFAVALKSMGKSLNSTDPADLEAAAKLLMAQKELVKTYNSNDFDNILAAGDVVLAHGYNGQLAKLAAKEPAKFAYVVPKEGATQAIDSLCILAKAKHSEAALAFINFVHEPEINAEIVNGVHYASPNTAARKFIHADILNNAAIYPSEETLKQCETMEDLGEATQAMDRYWTEIKAK
ncbi:MAG: spermidine/putrescine ABC transporter substrate-binding protein [Planctomycetes bacterium]|nr:spermidine/putrescine ABC transporter substrate-binding protein [Planctomycetota bacterium]